MSNKREAIILIVEDDILERQVADVMFRRANVINKIYFVKDGEEALDFLYKRNGFEDMPTPDILYLDIQMPKFSGTEVLEIMYKDPELSKISTIVLTGIADDTNMMVAREYGAIGYIIKPLDSRNIMETCTFNKSIKIKFVVDDELNQFK